MPLSASKLRNKANHIASHNPNKHRPQIPQKTNASNRTGKIQLLQCRQLAERLRQPPCSFSANLVPCKPTQKHSKPHCIAQSQQPSPSNPSKNKRLKPYRKDPAPAVPSACRAAPPTSLLLHRQSCSLQADSETKKNTLHRTIPTNIALKSLKKQTPQTVP